MVSLDGTGSGDEVTPRVIADYRYLPFPKGYFSEALGSCFLEVDEGECISLYKDIIPFLASGARLSVGSCDSPRSENVMAGVVNGLILIEYPGVYEDDGSLYYDGVLHWIHL